MPHESEGDAGKELEDERARRGHVRAQEVCVRLTPSRHVSSLIRAIIRVSLMPPPLFVSAPCSSCDRSRRRSFYTSIFYSKVAGGLGYFGIIVIFWDYCTIRRNSVEFGIVTLISDFWSRVLALSWRAID